ncbi:ferrous iron transport protein B [Desulfonatronum thiosulfatophilum]|uniref:Ferrous iron transport protein B n=1 Tax=Desulfonatronum thiosulfatophilum TaxID=617002 RepID=A0A1G6D8A0_9BACT|nr:ferrous iron transport protein B [Desulfonatronum thiosulfatophilum]SDB41414.1 ferrous iron transport protein B [Desulfonatronum thiosulfatophilum]
MSDIKKNIITGLAGQQNAGKSTIFNMLTGANQHIANYPGVTVDKKVGSYRDELGKVEVVDLPGTYSLTSFSLEERVARDFLLREKPGAIINVIDASSLRRGLYFTFQILEMSFPVVMALNMVDVAESNGRRVNHEKLAQLLGIEVVPTVGRKGKGKTELRQAVRRTAQERRNSDEESWDRHALRINYEELEGDIVEIHERLMESKSMGKVVPLRWMAVKLLEGDAEAQKILRMHHQDAEEILDAVSLASSSFQQRMDITTGDYIVTCRDRLAASIVEQCVETTREETVRLSEKIDRVLLNRAFAPVFLVFTVYLIYELSIVQGYKLTFLTWPALAWVRTVVAGLLPDPGLLQDTLIRSMSLWMVDSVNTLLNYVPIFLILFALIAILEDSGYMARIAFILDRVFQSFGLHGQSTLPFILGGVFTGGCAVPGIMATKGIPDERSRLATILTVPYMNCLAKIPLYTLLVSIYFAAYKSYLMLFISTITIIMAMIIAKLLTSTILRSRETAPFVMEMPNYHLPTLFGVLRRAFDRTWVYIKKVGTIVVAVAIVVYVLLQFPGLPDERMAYFEARMDDAIAEFRADIQDTVYADLLANDDAVLRLLNIANAYREAKLAATTQEASTAVDVRYEAMHPELFDLLRPRDPEARSANRSLRNLTTERSSLRTAIREETIVYSYFGTLGRALEPVTRYAGFDWKVNVALISSFAARESSVATLGVLFQEGADESMSLEERMGQAGAASGFTSLHAFALILFFALYPPCLATTIMVKVQTGSYKWMLFSIIFPTVFGLVVASSVFTVSSMLGLSGIQAMVGFYILALATAIILSFLPDPAWKASGPAISRTKEA